MRIGRPAPNSIRIAGLEPRKRLRDPNQLAKSVIGAATGELPDVEPNKAGKSRDAVVWLYEKRKTLDRKKA